MEKLQKNTAIQQQSKQLTSVELQSLRRWIRYFAIVSFDVDEGQKVDFIVPGSLSHAEQKSLFSENDLLLSKQKEKQLAMLAFPDSNTQIDHQGTFRYVFRNSEGFYGYTCFKQKKDKKNPRGYSQKSLVILTQLPFVGFFEKMVEFLVFYVLRKLQALELQRQITSPQQNKQIIGNPIQQQLSRLCKQIVQWPDPQPLTHYTLPILEHSLDIAIPNYQLRYDNSPILTRIHSSKNLSQKQIPSTLQAMLKQQSISRNGIFQEISLLSIFYHHIDTMLACWQFTMLNKSFMLVQDSPLSVSHAVLASVGLISPIIYAGNFNPYITVYDKKLNELQQQKNNNILGSTNPLLMKLFNKIQIIPLNPKPVSARNCYKSNIIHKRSRFVSLNQIITFTKNELNETDDQQQKAIHQATLRKYFYRANQNILNLLDNFLKCQKNDLKIFNKIQFLKTLAKRKEFLGLQNFFDGKKQLLSFMEQFCESKNFQIYLKKRNVVITQSY